MPHAFSLHSPNGRTILYFVAESVTGPTLAYRVRGTGVPATFETLSAVNAMVREEKVTIIAKLAEVAATGDETGVATGASQAAAEAATPTGTGQKILEELLTGARDWPSQSGGRSRHAGAYPQAGGSTGTGEVTLRLGKKDNGDPWEFTGVIEAVTPSFHPKAADMVVKLATATISFRIGKTLGA